jgi:Fic family protein
MQTSLADLVRTMNCYYSNIIEGHVAHPVDIERALKGDYSTDPEKRDLRLEAKAHIMAQQWIDAGGLKGRVIAVESIREIHRRFCELLPADLLSVEDPVTEEQVQIVPGALRTRGVKVGRHVAISPGAVPRFLNRFQEVYGALGTTDTVIAAAAAHHRLLWIHPFLDGNGRVARLLSHATLLDTLHTGAVWSIARGLARNVQAYKGHLAACDETRRNDLDGRGHLSEENLAEFTKFFLATCIDEVSFMESASPRRAGPGRPASRRRGPLGALRDAGGDGRRALHRAGGAPRADRPAGAPDRSPPRPCAGPGRSAERGRLHGPGGPGPR